MANQYSFPDVGLPLVDVKTGQINEVWLRFLVQQFRVSGGGTTTITVNDSQAEVDTARGPNLSDLKTVTNELRSLAGTSRNERSEIERLRARVADLESVISEQRSERPEIERLRSRSADLESLLMAMRQKNSLIEDLRREINDLKTLAQQVSYGATVQRLDVRLTQIETLVMGKR